MGHVVLFKTRLQCFHSTVAPGSLSGHLWVCIAYRLQTYDVNTHFLSVFSLSCGCVMPNFSIKNSLPSHWSQNNQIIQFILQAISMTLFHMVATSHWYCNNTSLTQYLRPSGGIVGTCKCGYWYFVKILEYWCYLIVNTTSGRFCLNL